MLDHQGPVSVTRALDAVLDEGADGTRSLTLGVAGDREVGIWEIEPGVAHDVEVDEVFVVLEGRATISVVGHEDLEIGPGDVVHLEEGTPTVWTVHQRLRKVYLVSADPR